MTVDPPDDDSDAEAAFTWDGETDASHVAGPKPQRARKPGRPEPEPAPRTVAEAPAGSAPADAAAATPASSFLLVTYGILAGAYALYAIGWLASILRSTLTLDNLLSEIMYQLGEFLAIAAAPLWFASVFFLTRGRRPIVRLLWLLVGLVLLVPVPFVLGV
jgi:hypothetical protein